MATSQARTAPGPAEVNARRSPPLLSSSRLTYTKPGLISNASSFAVNRTFPVRSQTFSSIPAGVLKAAQKLEASSEQDGGKDS